MDDLHDDKKILKGNEFMLKKFLCAALLLGLLAAVIFIYKRQEPSILTVKRDDVMARGVWVTVFSKEEVLYSKATANKLINFCKAHDLGEIYLQVYRGGVPYYDSASLKKDEYVRMEKSMGMDPVDFILAQAKKNGIKVYAWVNVLSIAQNKNAPILNKYGTSVLTKDKGSRVSIRTQDIDDSDRFYLRDDQLFLEPGDDRVVDFSLDVIREIIKRYPSFDGIHLDYVRYPYPVPFIPDSRFTDQGVSYGFGERNVSRFEKTYGLNPRKNDMYQNALYLKWDDWKRDQVTSLVGRISSLIREEAGAWRISAAVVPGFERAYSVAYQDWSLWVRNKIVDYVILMNYTRDVRLFEEISQAALTSYDRGKIYLGLGPFLFKKKEDYMLQELAARRLDPGGLVFFSYDELLSFYEED